MLSQRPNLKNKKSKALIYYRMHDNIPIRVIPRVRTKLRFKTKSRPRSKSRLEQHLYRTDRELDIKLNLDPDRELYPRIVVDL